MPFIVPHLPMYKPINNKNTDPSQFPYLGKKDHSQSRTAICPVDGELKAPRLHILGARDRLQAHICRLEIRRTKYYLCEQALESDQVKNTPLDSQSYSCSILASRYKHSEIPLDECRVAPKSKDSHNSLT